MANAQQVVEGLWMVPLGPVNAYLLDQGELTLIDTGMPKDEGKIVAAGGFEPDTAETTIENGIADAVAFGRHFVANPDLPLRIKGGLALTKYDRDTFWTFDSVGYNDYPFVNELVSR